MLAVGEIRRDRGTGSEPRWRSDNRWEARYTTPDGKRRSVFVRTPGTAGRRQAARLRDEALAAAAAGVDPSLQPLADYMDRYLARRGNLADASRDRYARLIRYHVRGSEAVDERGRRIADKPLVRLRPEDIEDLYAERSAHLAPKGVELLHTLLNGALAQAAARGKIIRNPAQGVDRPEVRRVAPDVYTKAQLRELLTAAEGTRLEGFVTVLATTGLRHGELLDLRWRDIREDRIVLVDPEKGGVPRTILLAPRAVRSLRAHRARQAEDRLSRAGAWEERDLVFPGRWGDRGDDSWNREQLHALASAHRLPPVTPRALRHAVATSLLEDGVPMKVVQELLGHRTYKQTADTYAHVSETMQAAIVAAMTRAVGE